jgi:hypothetical protein
MKTFDADMEAERRLAGYFWLIVGPGILILSGAVAVFQYGR